MKVVLDYFINYLYLENSTFFSESIFLNADDYE
jgi:hypothetical protein